MLLCQLASLHIGTNSRYSFLILTDELHPDTSFLVGRTVSCLVPYLNVPFWKGPIAEDREALVRIDYNSQQAM
jgi:hypothetical protein